jgi:hypothetical protein
MRKQPTNAELARRECCNFVAGKCILHGRCKVAAGQNCLFFDTAVLPAAQRITNAIAKFIESNSKKRKANK